MSCNTNDIKENVANTTWASIQVSRDGNLYSTIDDYDQMLGFHFNADNTCEILVGKTSQYARYEIQGSRIVFFQDGKRLDYCIKVETIKDKWMDAIMETTYDKKAFHVKFMKLPE